MRIALFTPTCLPSVNGIVTRIQQTLRSMQRIGQEVILVAPQHTGLPKEIEGYPVIGIPSFSFPGYPGFQYSVPWYPEGAKARLLAFAPQLVHAIDPVTGIGWLARQLAREMELPLVVSYHTNLPMYLHIYHLGFLEPVLWRYIAWMHAQAVLSICPSSSTQQTLHAHGIPNGAIWRSGVDTELFHPSHRSALWRRRLTDWHPDDCVLLYVGRLAAEKRIETLFPLLAVLNEERQVPCRLAIVGEGPLEEHLKEKSKGLPVTFLGRLTGEDLSAAYASADLFCLPSTSETFGNVTQEAMASGLVVVAARAGGTLDVVQEFHTGLLYDPTSPTQLVDMVRMVRNHDMLRKSMGVAARKAAERWTWMESALNLSAAYAQAIQKQQSVSRQVVREEVCVP